MKSHTKRNLSIVSGHVFEHYDVTLYGFFAVLLAPYFFPSDSYVSAQVSSLGAFAAGFLMRPLGGLIFGYIGDKYGRRIALLFSILLASLPTFLIGILPTHASIGIAAPIALVALRLIQGISVGGEFSGALVYVFEHNQFNKPGLKAGMLIGSGFAGAVLGTAIGAVCTSSFLPDWFWRVPFLLGGVFGIFIYWIRFGLSETPEFKKGIKPSKTIPFIQALKNDPKHCIATVVFGGANMVPLYLATVYMNSLLIDLGASKSSILINNTIVLACSGLLMPIMGHLADRFGSKRIMHLGLFSFIILGGPMYYFACNPLNLTNLYALQAFLVLGNACIISPLTSYIPGLFPVSYRYSAISSCYTTGQALLGGWTPLLAVVVASSLNGYWAVSTLLIAASLLFVVFLKICGVPKSSKLSPLAFVNTANQV